MTSRDDADATSEADWPSRARDHLANERTYLAWLRTAASVMVLGLAVAQFAAKGSAWSVVAGVLLIAVGAAGVAYGTVRYRRVTDEIEKGRFSVGPQARAAVTASTVLVLAVVAALVILLLTRP